MTMEQSTKGYGAYNYEHKGFLHYNWLLDFLEGKEIRGRE